MNPESVARFSWFCSPRWLRPLGVRAGKERILRSLSALSIGFALQSCKVDSVDHALLQMRSPAYVRTIESGAYQIEIRYVPRLLYGLSISPASADSQVPQARHELAKSHPELDSSLIFRVKISPKNDFLPASDMRNDVFVSQSAGASGYMNTLEGYCFGMKKKFWIKGISGSVYPNSVLLSSGAGIEKDKSLIVIFHFGKKFVPKGPLVLVTDDVVPGAGTREATWNFPISKYDELI